MRAIDPSTGLELPFFDGFPYWNTRLAPGIYHITLLPPAPVPILLEATRLQAHCNQLPVCLVQSDTDARCYLGDGRVVTIDPPCGGIMFSGVLRPGLIGDPSSHDLRLRAVRLATLLDGQPDGTVFGDLTKGGRPATPAEAASLAGFQSDGTPRGLDRCAECGDWKGVCLDPSPMLAGDLVRVHCLCENDNRCARCWGLLHERLLNGNYYNPKDGKIWHVPGFSCMEHRCPGTPP